MKQTQLFTKTQKNAPADEVSKNAELLIRAGYVAKEMAGVYSFLPLGLKVLEKINTIIREELEKIGGQELFMSALQSKETWEKTRWDDKAVDVWFKTELQVGGEVGLGFTHEEPITKIMKNFVSSYKDLPFYPYQIQTKFRNEVRAKSGIMRGREFLMNDMYSFSKDEDEHKVFYEKCIETYHKIFQRLGIGDSTFLTFASGGSFAKYSHEFQTICEVGEDIVYLDRAKKIAVNEEVYNEEVLADLNLDKSNLEKIKVAETGNIFTLGTKFSESLDLKYKNQEGGEEFVFMGSYGIGPSRIMGVLVENFADEKGIVWPESVAPFKVHLINIGEEEKTEELYQQLKEKGVEVLWDNRDKRPGEKFADSDLMGIPHRVVVSSKSVGGGGVELKKRNESESSIISIEKLLDILK